MKERKYDMANSMNCPTIETADNKLGSCWCRPYMKNRHSMQITSGYSNLNGVNDHTI